MQKNNAIIKDSSLHTLLIDDAFIQFLKSGQIAAIYLDNDGTIQYVTPILSSIMGLSMENYGLLITDVIQSEQFTQLKHMILNYIHHVNENRDADMTQLQALNQYQSEIEITGLNKISYQLVIRYNITNDNKVNGIIILLYDISQRKAIENNLKLEKEKYRIFAELTECALWEYNIKTKEFKHFRKLKGRYANHNLTIPDFRNTMIQKGWLYPEDIQEFEAFCDSMDRGEEFIQYDLRSLGDNDEYIWIRYQGTALRDEHGNTSVILGRTLNIDNEYREHEKIVQRLLRDGLTGLYNRATTKEKVDQCLERSNLDEKQSIHNFMIIDIDNFQQINELLGHVEGDEIIEMFSKELEKLFHSTDIIGRIGGDKFLVLQKDIKKQNQIKQTLAAICEMARNQLHDFQKNKLITVSIGCASYPADGNDYETLYRKADIALYIAKSRGKDQFVLYQQDMECQYLDTEFEPFLWNSSGIDTSNVDKRIMNIALDILNDTSNLHYSINHVLHEVGKFFNLSRITVYETEIGNKEARVHFEWRNLGIPSAEYDLLEKNRPMIKNYKDIFMSNNILYINDVATEKLPFSLELLFARLGTKAVVQCAIYDGDTFIGTVNFEDCISARCWSKYELDTLYTLTRFLSTYILQLRSKLDLDNELFFSQATLSNQKLCNYAVKEGTYELVYFSEYTKKQFPNVKLGAMCYNVIYGRETPCDPCPLSGLNTYANTYSIETYHNKDNAWYSTTATREVLPDGSSIDLICSVDVTGFIDRVHSTDAMTGVLTLSKFEAEAMKLISGSSKNKYCIIYCDFDKFKNINDSWGYSIGNEVLIHFAKLIDRSIKGTELTCRISDDKFLIMLSYKNKSETIERIKVFYNQLEEYFSETFPRIKIVITGGIYFLKQEDKVLSIAIDRANLARKTVKGTHKSDFAIYDNFLHTQVSKEKMIENRMNEALKNNEFIVYLQPKIDLSSRKIVGAEALVRWRFPSGQILSPNDFIPIFEKNGFVTDLDFYVYEKTLSTLQKWLLQGNPEIIISINVSGIHLNEANFLDRFLGLLEKYNIPPRLIELEITESIFFKELDRLVLIINSFRQKGFLISIDDFGSGYSSLNMLKTLPIDILKLDREFFMWNEMGVQDKIVISGIISLAKGLGLKVVSEGVETEEQVEFLLESSCDMAQGYLFYKPMPVEEFEKLLDIKSI